MGKIVVVCSFFCQLYFIESAQVFKLSTSENAYIFMKMLIFSTNEIK